MFFAGESDGNIEDLKYMVFKSLEKEEVQCVKGPVPLTECPLDRSLIFNFDTTHDGGTFND